MGYEELWNQELKENIAKNDVFDVFYTIEGHKRIIPEERILLQEIPKESKILDIGCSYGRLMRLFPNATGVDVSKEMLERNPFKNRIKLLDATKKLPFQNNSFENVFCFRVLLHCNGKGDRERVIKEAMRVLKVGGSLYFDVSKFFNWSWFVKRIYWGLKGTLKLISADELTIRGTRKMLERLDLDYELIDNDNQVIVKIEKGGENNEKERNT